MRTEISDRDYYILFLNEAEGNFPLYSAGSWIAKRDGRRGALLQVKIFYRSDPGSFIRLFPQRERTMMDVYLNNSLLHRAVPLGTSLSILLTESFQEIIERSKGTVDWSTLLQKVPYESYRATVSMVHRIRRELPRLSDAEDGAMDRDGNLVYIATLQPQGGQGGLNCSGFAKWVADGLFQPLQGRYLDIEELKVRHSSHRGNRISQRFEEDRDPYFGLDWTRNIARSFSRDPNPEKQDVRNLPYWRYREDIGFSIQELAGILFYLSLTEPGNFYLGSINREFGQDPVLRQHFHVVVIFPFMTAGGDFQVAVFERNVETNLASLIRRYRGNFIHMVRIPANTSFDPPRIE